MNFITIQANGEPYNIEDQTPLPEFLKQMGLNLKQVIVEHNGEAKPRKEAASICLSNGDVLEVVRIVAGG